MNRKEAIKYLKQLYPNGGHCWLDEQRIEAIGMAINKLTENHVQHPWSVIHIIDGAMAGDTDKVKRYARRLADTYIKDDDQKFADCILSAIGEKEVAMATMDEDEKKMEKIEQKPVEWSEEDLDNINKIDNIICDNDRITIEEDAKLRNWLKSLRPQKQWKPSDLQI